jgi:hypothetical protein
MDESKIILYLNHKSTLTNPSPNRFKPEVKDFLERWRTTNDISEQNVKITFFMYIHNIKKVPLCEYPNCTSNVRYNTYSTGFSVGCCRDHAQRASNLKKFGVEKPFQLSEIRKKVSATYLEKYGNVNPCMTANFTKVMLARYGSKTAMQSPILKERLRKNLIEKYGGIGNASKTIFEKQKQTMISKFGVETFFTHSDFNHIVMDTCLEKYGVEHHSQSSNVKEKKRLVMQSRYGVDNCAQIPHIVERWQRERKEKLFDNYYNHWIKFVELKFDKDNFVDADNDLICICKTCCEEFEFSLNSENNIYCPFCSKNKSLLEREIFNFIADDGKVSNDRTILNGKELDIYLPSKNVAIEVDGIYWHSELNGKGKNYHLSKTATCLEKDIQLIHIFENDWMQKPLIVKSLINTILGKFEKTILTEKCQVREITVEEKNSFLEENHLRGIDESTIRFGLLCETVLLSVMTFIISEKYQFELIRYCTKVNYDVVDSFSKLWNFFVNTYNPKQVITFVDRRYSNGDVFKHHNFTQIDITSPKYHYFKNDCVLVDVDEFKKNKFECLPTFDTSLTEWENMQLNGYDRIWDCGELVFVWQSIS